MNHNDNNTDQLANLNTDNHIREPKQVRSIRTKEAILKAAMKLFSETGFHRTNTKQIAAEARVSTGSFYSYYTDKRAVFIDALLLYSQLFRDKLGQLLEQIDLSKNDKHFIIAQLVESLIQSHDVYLGIYSELKIMYEADAEVREIIDRAKAASRENTKKYLYIWKDELKVTDLDAASVVVFEALDRLVDLIKFYEVGISAEQIKNETVDLIYAYLFLR